MRQGRTSLVLTAGILLALAAALGGCYSTPKAGEARLNFGRQVLSVAQDAKDPLLHASALDVFEELQASSPENSSYRSALKSAQKKVVPILAREGQAYLDAGNVREAHYYLSKAVAAGAADCTTQAAEAKKLCSERVSFHLAQAKESGGLCLPGKSLHHLLLAKAYAMDSGGQDAAYLAALKELHRDVAIPVTIAQVENLQDAAARRAVENDLLVSVAQSCPPNVALVYRSSGSNRSAGGPESLQLAVSFSRFDAHTTDRMEVVQQDVQVGLERVPNAEFLSLKRQLDLALAECQATPGDAEVAKASLQRMRDALSSIRMEGQVGSAVGSAVQVLDATRGAIDNMAAMKVAQEAAQAQQARQAQQASFGQGLQMFGSVLGDFAGMQGVDTPTEAIQLANTLQTTGMLIEGIETGEASFGQTLSRFGGVMGSFGSANADIAQMAQSLESTGRMIEQIEAIQSGGGDASMGSLIRQMSGMMNMGGAAAQNPGAARAVEAFDAMGRTLQRIEDLGQTGGDDASFAAALQGMGGALNDLGIASGADPSYRETAAAFSKLGQAIQRFESAAGKPDKKTQQLLAYNARALGAPIVPGEVAEDNAKDYVQAALSAAALSAAEVTSTRSDPGGVQAVSAVLQALQAPIAALAADDGSKPLMESASNALGNVSGLLLQAGAQSARAGEIPAAFSPTLMQPIVAQEFVPGMVRRTHLTWEASIELIDPATRASVASDTVSGDFSAEELIPEWELNDAGVPVSAGDVLANTVRRAGLSGEIAAHAVPLLAKVDRSFRLDRAERLAADGSGERALDQAFTFLALSSIAGTRDEAQAARACRIIVDALPPQDKGSFSAEDLQYRIDWRRGNMNLPPKPVIDDILGAWCYADTTTIEQRNGNIIATVSYPGRTYQTLDTFFKGGILHVHAKETYTYRGPRYEWVQMLLDSKRARPVMLELAVWGDEPSIDKALYGNTYEMLKTK